MITWRFNVVLLFMVGMLLTLHYVEGNLGSVLTQSKGDARIVIYPTGRRDGIVDVGPIRRFPRPRPPFGGRKWLQRTNTWSHLRDLIVAICSDEVTMLLTSFLFYNKTVKIVSFLNMCHPFLRYSVFKRIPYVFFILVLLSYDVVRSIFFF